MQRYHSQVCGESFTQEEESLRALCQVAIVVSYVWFLANAHCLKKFTLIGASAASPY